MKGIRLEDRSRKTRVVGGASVCSSRKARPRGCVGAARFPKAERPGALICDVAGRRYCDEPPGDSGLGTRDSGLGRGAASLVLGSSFVPLRASRGPGSGCLCASASASAEGKWPPASAFGQVPVLFSSWPSMFLSDRLSTHLTNRGSMPTKATPALCEQLEVMT